ncbi:AAA family ATPase [Sinorhizobium meliloti]|nr:AAA family ATPase [Sinorhizobium meliloti]
MASRPDIRFFWGTQPEPPSERRYLQTLLAELQEDAVVLMNFHLHGRQIDIVIITERRVQVVEAKASALPVFGKINGQWTRPSSGAKPAQYPNAYQQALEAKNRLRDAMSGWRAIGKFYPEACVAFIDDIPARSAVTPGDFKVRVGGTQESLELLHTPATNPWSLQDWEIFAKSALGLTPVSRPTVNEMVKHPEVSAILNEYRQAVTAEYGLSRETWMPENAEQRAQLREAVSGGSGCAIVGPSGCGKTLISRWLASELAADGAIPIVMAGGEFSGNWSDALKREIGLLTDHDLQEIRRAITTTLSPVILIFDGINELSQQSLSGAVRGLRALARRLGARIVVTSQQDPPIELSGLTRVQIDVPSKALKRSIARRVTGHLSSVAIQVLDAVAVSGMEASIVGHIGGEITKNATRLSMCDQFVRSKLGPRARQGAYALRRFAGYLHGKVAFSATEIQFDELMRENSVSFDDCNLLFNHGILRRRAGRVSFNHEILRNALAAYDLAQDARGNGETFGLILGTPLFEKIAPDVIAATDDQAVCHEVLSRLSSAALLAAGARGELGEHALIASRALLDSAKAAVANEIDGLVLTLKENDRGGYLSWDDATLVKWSAEERARISALGLIASQGTATKDYLELCARMDARLLAERQRLAASTTRTLALKSHSFSLAYMGMTGECGFTIAARSRDFRFDQAAVSLNPESYDIDQLSHGQLHFFLDNYRLLFPDGDQEWFARFQLHLLRNGFKALPYHVQLALLHSVGFTRSLSEEVSGEIIDALHAIDMPAENWAINTSIIDALKLLGGLDSDAERARDDIENEIRGILTEEESEEVYTRALMLTGAMFDHPFSGIYAEIIFDLDDADRALLYRRALKEPEVSKSTNVAWLLSHIIALDLAEDDDQIRVHTSLPDPTNPFPQDTWGAFVLAVQTCGRREIDMVDIEPTAAAERCLIEVRELLYNAANGKRPPKPSADRLSTFSTQLAVGVLSEVQGALDERYFYSKHHRDEPAISLAAAYHPQILDICRRFVDDGVDAEFYQAAPWRDRGIQYALNILAAQGDRTDINRLRQKIVAHPFASFAVEALKRLDQ